MVSSSVVTHSTSYLCVQMKDVPKLGGPDSLFYRAGLDPLPPPRLAPAPATTAPGAGQRLQQPPAEHGAKVRDNTSQGEVRGDCVCCRRPGSGTRCT